MRRSLVGIQAVLTALDSGKKPGLVLVGKGDGSPALEALLARLRADEVPVHFESAREMRRMFPDGVSATEDAVLGLCGPAPAQDLATLMGSSGVVFGLIGLRYPGNAGFILRSVEVAGGAGVVLDSEWGEAQMEEALRTGMRPERFMPVLRAEVFMMIRAARAAGRQVLAIETSGARPPWESNFDQPALILVGSEAEGLSEAVLAEADQVVRIPAHGFIPSYNVQAAVGICLGEWLRQTA